MPTRKKAKLTPARKRVVSNKASAQSSDSNSGENISLAVPPPITIPGRIPMRILIVIDGRLSFGDNDLGLDELLTEILYPMSIPATDLRITTAHRGLDPRANLQNFVFTDDNFNISLYEQLWMYGIVSESTDHAGYLAMPEARAISRFMQAGGGVVAMGDHESLGYAMCGQLARVSTMRKWKQSETPPVFGINRNDTLQPGHDGFYQNNDQADDIPQVIEPKMYRLPGASESYPHPLLAYGEKVINQIPDHMHEGVCVEPTGELIREFAYPGLRFYEYPKLPGQEIRLRPEVIATSMAAGGSLDSANPAVIPHCFGAYCAYDGHLVSVGRVVTESSFHHTVNINLRGTNPGEPNYEPDRIGFYVRDFSTTPPTLRPTPVYEKYKFYFRNLALWLNPRSSSFRRYGALLAQILLSSPTDEEILSIDGSGEADSLLAGAVMHRALRNYFSPAEALSCALVLANQVLAEETRNVITNLVNPWTPPEMRTGDSGMRLDPAAFAEAIIGGVTISIAQKLPTDLSDRNRALELLEAQKGGFEAIVTTGVTNGIKALSLVTGQSNSDLQRLASALARAANSK